MTTGTGTTRGGRPRWCTRSTPGPSPAPTATGSATSSGLRAHLDHLALARCRRHLAVAGLPLPDARLRLRRQRLLRHRPDLRHRSPTSTTSWPTPTPPASGWCSTSCRTTPPTSTRGSGPRGRAATTPSVTGTCGATPPPTAAHPTTGSRRSSTARRGPSTSRPGQYYLHCFLARAARSQLGQSRSRRGHARRVAASGSIAGSTASASTSCT